MKLPIHPKTCAWPWPSIHADGRPVAPRCALIAIKFEKPSRVPGRAMKKTPARIHVRNTRLFLPSSAASEEALPRMPGSGFAECAMAAMITSVARYRFQARLPAGRADRPQDVCAAVGSFRTLRGLREKLYSSDKPIAGAQIRS